MTAAASNVASKVGLGAGGPHRRGDRGSGVANEMTIGSADEHAFNRSAELRTCCGNPTAMLVNGPTNDPARHRLDQVVQESAQSAVRTSSLVTARMLIGRRPRSSPITLRCGCRRAEQASRAGCRRRWRRSFSQTGAAAYRGNAHILRSWSQRGPNFGEEWRSLRVAHR